MEIKFYSSNYKFLIFNFYCGWIFFWFSYALYNHLHMVHTFVQHCTTCFFVQQYLYNVQPNKCSIYIFLLDSSLCNNCLMFYDTEQVLNKGVQLFTTMHKYIQLCTCCTWLYYSIYMLYNIHYASVQVLKIFGSNTYNILVVVLLAVHGCTSLYNVEKGLFNIVQGCSTLYNLVQTCTIMYSKFTMLYNLVQCWTTLYNVEQPFFNIVQTCTTMYSQ